MENSLSQKIPICQACASGSNQEPQAEEDRAVVPAEEAAPSLEVESERRASEEVTVELRDPCLNHPRIERTRYHAHVSQRLDTGVEE